jgi:hypothetical protein
MIRRTLAVVVAVLLLAMTPPFGGKSQAYDDPDTKPVKLKHKTLDVYAGGDDGWLRFELTGALEKGAGKGKLRITRDDGPPKGEGIRNLFGDRTDRASKSTTEHDITLKLVRSRDDLPHEIARLVDKSGPIIDPSPKKDRSLYVIGGVDFGTNRGLLLMVSASGPQRLIYIGRYLGPYPVTLEPQDSFDGPETRGK